MDEKLNWEKKEKLNFTNVLDKISDASNQVVQRELTDIAAKIDGLHKMGFIKDNENLAKMKEQLSKLKIG